MQSETNIKLTISDYKQMLNSWAKYSASAFSFSLPSWELLLLEAMFFLMSNDGENGCELKSHFCIEKNVDKTHEVWQSAKKFGQFEEVKRC